MGNQSAFQKYKQSRAAFLTPQDLFDKVEKDAFEAGYKAGQDELLNMAQAIVDSKGSTVNHDSIQNAT